MVRFFQIINEANEHLDKPRFSDECYYSSLFCILKPLCSQHTLNHTILKCQIKKPWPNKSGVHNCILTICLCKTFKTQVTFLLIHDQYSVVICLIVKVQNSEVNLYGSLTLFIFENSYYQERLVSMGRKLKF